jgi:hypothetical protein
MRTIKIDATNWKTILDFYHAMLPAVGAPPGHGIGIAAFIDSMIWGGMNSIEPPYTVRIEGTANLPEKVRNEIELLKQALARGRPYFFEAEGHQAEVYLETDT